MTLVAAAPASQGLEVGISKCLLNESTCQPWNCKTADRLEEWQFSEGNQQTNQQCFWGQRRLGGFSLHKNPRRLGPISSYILHMGY